MNLSTNSHFLLTNYSATDRVTINDEGIFDHVLMNFSVDISVDVWGHQQIVKLCRQNFPLTRLNSVKIIKRLDLLIHLSTGCYKDLVKRKQKVVLMRIHMSCMYPSI